MMALPPSRRTRRLGVVIMVGGIAIAGAVALAASVGLSPGPRPSVPPVGSPVRPDPIPTATAAPTRTVMDVPATVDATGSTDVTDQLQSVIDMAPDGAVIRLGSGATYRIEQRLLLENRDGLEIDGRGATLLLVESSRSHRRNLWLLGSRSIRIHDLTLVGSNPAPGVLDEGRQFEHGVWVDGGGGITLERIVFENTWGDCVYLGDRDGRLDWVDGLVLRDSSCHGTGRNGVSIVAGRNVRIQESTFGNIGLHVIDIEPNKATPPQGAARVAVIGNRVEGPVEDYFFAANGWGAVSDLTVEDNVLVGVPLRITVQPLSGSGYVRRAVRIADNRSDTAYADTGAGAFRFRAVIGLTVTGNVVPLEGSGAALVQVEDSCQVTIAGNRYPGGAVEWRGSYGACPIENPG